MFKNLGKNGGFSLIEILTILAIMAFVVTVSFLALSSSRGKTSFDQLKVRIAALLSDAQSRSVNQENGAAWGVHFDNTGSQPFYSLFSGAYSTSSERGHYPLPPQVQYVSSSIAVGASRDIMFKTVSGAASSSGSVSVQLTVPPLTSSTISVSASGAVSY